MQSSAAMTAATFVVALGAPACRRHDGPGQSWIRPATRDKAHRQRHGAVADCATMCAKKGAAMALVTEDGKVYTLAGGLAADNNAKIIPHISHTVEVTGDVTEKDGKMTITSDSVKMLKK